MKEIRQLTDHKVNGLNEAISIFVVDQPGQGNANHEYLIIASLNELSDTSRTSIKFQNGPIQEAGVNGISNEALIAIVIDRLRGFQSGQYACRENALALTKLEEAQMWLQKRTRDRMARGVEGTNKV